MLQPLWCDLPTLDRLEYLFWVETLISDGRLPSTMTDEEIIEKCESMYYCDISLETTK